MPALGRQAQDTPESQPWEPHTPGFPSPFGLWPWEDMHTRTAGMGTVASVT